MYGIGNTTECSEMQVHDFMILPCIVFPRVIFPVHLYLLFLDLDTFFVYSNGN